MGWTHTHMPCRFFRSKVELQTACSQLSVLLCSGDETAQSAWLTPVRGERGRKKGYDYEYASSVFATLTSEASHHVHIMRIAVYWMHGCAALHIQDSRAARWALAHEDSSSFVLEVESRARSEVQDTFLFILEQIFETPNKTDSPAISSRQTKNLWHDITTTCIKRQQEELTSHTTSLANRRVGTYPTTPRQNETSRKRAPRHRITFVIIREIMRGICPHICHAHLFGSYFPPSPSLVKHKLSAGNEIHEPPRGENTKNKELSSNQGLSTLLGEAKKGGKRGVLYEGVKKKKKKVSLCFNMLTSLLVRCTYPDCVSLLLYAERCMYWKPS